MKISIDKTRCTGHGRCYVMAPDVFDSDDEGYGMVRAAEVPPELEHRARIAEANCPERAVVVEA